jgi:hypothetical protein
MGLLNLSINWSMNATIQLPSHVALTKMNPDETVTFVRYRNLICRHAGGQGPTHQKRTDCLSPREAQHEGHVRRRGMRISQPTSGLLQKSAHNTRECTEHIATTFTGTAYTSVACGCGDRTVFEMFTVISAICDYSKALPLSPITIARGPHTKLRADVIIYHPAVFL